MNRKEMITQFVTELGTQFPDFTVKTPGGGDADLPAIVLNYTVNRSSMDGGHTSFAGVTRDEYGNADGRILERYYRVTVDCVVKSYDEELRDDTIVALGDYFVEYEDDPSLFDSDTFEWEVQGESPRNNPVIEPDWYESSLPVQFKMVQRTTTSADALTDVQESVEINDNIDN